MKKFFHSKKKWILWTVILFFAVFTAVNLYQGRDVSHAADYIIRDSSGTEITDTYNMRRATDTLTVYGTEPTDDLQWTSANTSILSLTPATANSTSVQINAVSTGTVAVNLLITHDDGSTEELVVVVEVVFSINEYLNYADDTVQIVKVNKGDNRRAIVMDYGKSLYFGTSALTETNKLNLIFGDATKAVWTSSNQDIIKVNRSASDPMLTAVGAGRTTLSVSYSDGAEEYTDSIVVYVRPEVRYEGNIVGSGTSGSSSITVENGDSLEVSAQFAANPLISISSKLVWVVAKDKGEDTVLVRDSLGKTGEGGDDVKLEFNSTTCSYRLNAKSGKYKLLFYVAGTYTSFEDAQSDDYLGSCAPVALDVTVNSAFTDKSVTINLGGSYNLAEAFNISLDVLKENFTATIINNPGNCISWDRNTMTATGLATGTAKMQVVINSDASADIPGRTVDVVDLTINVADTFSMNISSTTMAVGSKLNLSGIIGSGIHVDDSAFTWSTTDESETFVSLSKNGQYATVTAKRTTIGDTPVVVTLSWTDNEGVTRTATCDIYVTASASTIGLNYTELEMETGNIDWLDTGLSGTQNLTWVSSNTDIVTVTPQVGNCMAMVTAGKEVGTAVVTVINKDNNAYATCVVTVSAAMTSLSIDKGTSYSTYMSAGYVFMKAAYEPKNATATELNWLSSNPSIATIDENGVVTLKKEGTTIISVQPVYNPNGLYASCVLTIEENPITKIIPDVTKLDMIQGDTYGVSTIIEPSDATNPTLTWTSGDQSIAKVEGGIITAVGVGTTTITVSGGDALPVTILVNVRNRLQSIGFESNEYTVKMGDTKPLNVIFTPSENVNKNLSWTTSNGSVVTVDDKGNITGVSEGMAMITCVSEDLGITYAITCLIHVTKADVIATDLTIDPTAARMYVGGELQIKTIFTPETATDQNIIWASSDTSVASVDNAGLVTAVAVGNVSITAIYNNTPDGEPWIRTCNIIIGPEPISVTGVTLTPNLAEVSIGETVTLTATVSPENATNKNVTFQSSDTSIATVDSAGIVSGVATGGAVIMCRTEDGDFMATCNITVSQGVTLTLNPSVREIAVGKSFRINRTVLPETADKTATWTSSNTSVASVSSSGNVTAKKKGKTTIRCRLNKYNVQAVCRVTVKKLNSTIKLNKTKIRIGKGQTYRMKATVWSNNSSLPKVKWTSSNKKVATVGSAGRVRAKRLGYTTITATTKDTVKARARCRVQVIQRATSVRVKPDYAVCFVGRNKKLRATVNPRTATIRSVSWKSSNTKVATVVNGRVRGISEGTVKITATARDGSRKKGSCHVRVLEQVPSSSVVVAQSEITMKRGDRAKLSYSVLPDNSSDSIKFASDNKRVATVSSSGRIHAVGTGTCTITLMMTSGITSTVTVNVVALNKSVLNIRQYDTETLTMLGTDKTVTWYSSNVRVATVINGKIVGRSAGTAYIYGYVDGCKVGCKVNVSRLR